MLCCNRKAVQTDNEEHPYVDHNNPFDKMTSACYLIYNTDRNGSLRLEYRNSPPPSYCAYSKGGDPYQKWKFTAQGIRQLCSSAGTAKYFYMGIGLFIKEAHRNNDKVYLERTQDTQAATFSVTLHFADNSIAVFTSGEVKGLANADHACVGHETPDAFSNGISYTPELFVQHAEDRGYAVVKLSR